ncbi:MAG: hypothetical protein ACHQHN_01035 [Sphingobacteriales bacterium]
MKSSFTYFCKFILVLACLVSVKSASAQMENDGIMIPKNYLCPSIMYGNSNWSYYWEGTYKRNNGNIGNINSNMYSLMVTYGVTNNLIATVNLPYISTHATAGTLGSQKGFQDLSLNLKWKAFKLQEGSSKLAVFASVTGSIPISNYEADFLPLSLGSHSKDLTGRIVVDYTYGKAFFTGSGAYMSRGNTTIDRTSYYTTELIYSNQVELPAMSDYNFRAGYRSKYLIVEGVADISTSIGGFDIRKNDMPFPSNRMNMSTVGGNLRFRPKALYNLELIAGDDYVVAGRNVGQANMIHGGLSYIFGLKSKQTADNYYKN